MVIVYGGSFNPPTIAHKMIIELLNNKFNPQKIIILPVGTNYYLKEKLAENIYRVKMLELMLDDIKNVLISDLEMNDDYQGTYHTLKKLNTNNENIYFVLGADNLYYLDKWINAKKLVSEYKFIVLRRNGIDVEKIIEEKFKKNKENFIIIDLDLKISATLVRENIEKNKDLITKEVYNYIIENNLYKKE